MMNLKGLVRKINKNEGYESVFLFGQYAESCKIRDGHVEDMRGNRIDSTLGFVRHHYNRPQYIASAANMEIERVKEVLAGIDPNDKFWD